MPFRELFSGDLERDWASLCLLWFEQPCVMQAEVGPTWEMPDQHKACLEFARRFPDSKEFLIRKLSDPSPLVAAYAFKCLIRISDLKKEELPEGVRSRREGVTLLNHCESLTKSLAEFFNEYFETYGSRSDLLEEDKRTLDWQQNELERYKRDSRNPSA